MKTKLKYLFLALLGLILIPTTNAYELSTLEVDSSYDDYNSSTFIRYDNSCLKFKSFPPGIVLNWGGREDYSVPTNIDCWPDGIKGSFYANEQIGYYKDTSSLLFFPSGSYDSRLVYLAVSRDWEGLNIFRTSLSDNKQSIHTLNLPSRTAYKYTNSQKKDFMLTHFVGYHNSFMLYDPITRFWVSFLGKMRIENGMVLARPDRMEDNFMFINFQAKKAYSATLTQTAAAKWLYWQDVSMERLQSVQFDKSYTMEEWWNSFLPQTFFNSKQLETTGWIYQEDIEFIVPDWNGGSSSNANAWSTAEAYNQCINYYNSIKTYAVYDRNCYLDIMDNHLDIGIRQQISDWDWEWEWIEIKGSRICSLFQGYKKNFKAKYKDKWKEFQEIAQANWLSPQSIDIKGYCWEKPKADFYKDLKEFWQKYLSNLWKTVGTVNGREYSINEFEKDFWEYLAYVRACNHKTYLPTPYDSWKSYILGYDYFFNWNNNENVCKFSETLKKRIKRKYWNLVFTQKYKDVFIADFGSWALKDDWKINFENYEKFANSLPASPYASSWDSGIFSFIKNDYKEGVDTSFKLLSNVQCWVWFWVKERDYIVYLPLFLLLYKIIKWRL